MRISKESIVKRFLRYVSLETTSDPMSEETPSSDKEWDLAHLLCFELQGMGLAAAVDDHCYVTATIGRGDEGSAGDRPDSPPGHLA